MVTIAARSEPLDFLFDYYQIMARTPRSPQEREFGERLSMLLTQARHESSKTVQDAATAAGVSVDGIYAVERGQVLSPGVRTVYLLSSAYGLDLTHLARRAEGTIS